MESGKFLKMKLPFHLLSNNKTLGTVPAMTQAEVDYAVASARAALPAWRVLSAVERAAYLHKVVDILERDQGEKGGEILLKKLLRGSKRQSGR